MAQQRPTWLVMGPNIVEIDRIVIRDVQYKFEVIRCRNEEVNTQLLTKFAFFESGRRKISDRAPPQPPSLLTQGSDQNSVTFQGFSANCVGGAGNQDGRMDRQTDITTISPLFLRKAWG
ncbi:hypothetical protein DPMN_088582 [Dreissena polymorpha]|uniref:Uncharacterized protein n=1 Tax=Dreissena polymorpha TaxID=45954 RepID=A0A9D4QX83_DREPO|nr:hypothetical protein DPMN_088582 [Dreissena polymorpha]